MRSHTPPIIQKKVVGDLEDWWTVADKKAFEERAAKIVNYYSNYKTSGKMQTDMR